MQQLLLLLEAMLLARSTRRPELRQLRRLSRSNAARLFNRRKDEDRPPLAQQPALNLSPTSRP